MKKSDSFGLLERRLGYTFKNPALLTQAVTHKSASHINNERLEFLGDAILSCVIADLLYQQFSGATEGQLTRARASLVKKPTLSAVAQELKLGDHLQLGIGEQRSGGFRRDSILADAFEGLLGALYCDGGYDLCYQMIQQWFASRLAVIKPEAQAKDPKTQLQEWLQANHHSLPVYAVLSVKGEAHAQVFTVNCEIPDLGLVAQGEAESRRIAEQIAASQLLEKINDL